MAKVLQGFRQAFWATSDRQYRVYNARSPVGDTPGTILSVRARYIPELTATQALLETNWPTKAKLAKASDAKPRVLASHHDVLSCRTQDRRAANNRQRVAFDMFLWR